MAHAFLSASGSYRWLNCQPSTWLEKHFEDKGSVYAEEGSLAHALAEIYALNALGQEIPLNAEYMLTENPLYSKDMQHHAENYASLIAEKVNEYKARRESPIVFIEEQLDFSTWVPEGFGTGDCVIAAKTTLEIIDFKYGKGVPVSAENNSQMLLYALGAYDLLSVVSDFVKIKMTVVQPRLDSISEWEISTAELLAWGDSIKPIAEKAFKGEGEYKAGDHCKFCKANPTCKTLAEYYLDLAKFNLAKADLIADEDMAEILLKARTLKGWLEKLESQALDEALAGREYPGLKLVEGRSNRVITNVDELSNRLLQEYTRDEVYKPDTLISLTDLEKLIGAKKFKNEYGDLLHKAEGKPALVESGDKRPALTIRNAADIFADDLEEEEGEFEI